MGTEYFLYSNNDKTYICLGKNYGDYYQMSSEVIVKFIAEHGYGELQLRGDVEDTLPHEEPGNEYDDLTDSLAGRHDE